MQRGSRGARNFLVTGMPFRVKEPLVKRLRAEMISSSEVFPAPGVVWTTAGDVSQGTSARTGGEKTRERKQKMVCLLRLGGEAERRNTKETAQTSGAQDAHHLPAAHGASEPVQDLLVVGGGGFGLGDLRSTRVIRGQEGEAAHRRARRQARKKKERGRDGRERERKHQEREREHAHTHIRSK